MMASSMPTNATSSSDASRLRSLFASGALIHPYLSPDHFKVKGGQSKSDDDGAHHVRDNFVDLAASLSICCGVTPPPVITSDDSALSSPELDADGNSNRSVEHEIQRRRLQLASEIGGTAMSMSTSREDNDLNNGDNNDNDNSGNTATAIYGRKHIILILCDGMGNSILQNALCDDDDANDSSSSPSSFFMRNNQPSRLRAVFPSTTPAALTTLATAAWPGRHGMPGWNLRDKKGCDLPGNQNDNDNNGAHQPVQLLVLSDHIRDARSGQLSSEMGFRSWDEVFVEEPWARRIPDQNKSAAGQNKQQSGNNSRNINNNRHYRRMIYVNAYNGDDYQNWSQGGDNDDNINGESKRKHSDATDFSSWFIGDDDNTNTTTRKDDDDDDVDKPALHHSTLFETAKIEETAFDTLGTPEGSGDAISYFRQGINAALRSIANAERSGDSTFTYLYTAHPDKHMHALGVEHEEVRKVVRGIEGEVERFWRVLGDRTALLSGQYGEIECKNAESVSAVTTESIALDAAVVVTADHGHVTVHENDMMELPKNVLDMLEYACIGVHGKGRHGYLHCRAGLQSELLRRWKANADLSDNFILLTIEDAVEFGLFGPDHMRLEVRPRLGDFVAISIGRKTLVTPSEVTEFRTPCRCQGAHGSLLPEEMCIPFILLSPDSE